MKTKISITILITLLFASMTILFAGCTKKADFDEFVEVCEIEYTTNGVKTTQNSTYEIMTSQGVSATKAEFDSAVIKFTSSPFGNNKLTAKSKTVTSYGGLTKDDIGKSFYYRYTHWDNYAYSKYEFQGFSYNYIKVKVLDSATIIVRDNKGDTTYTVSSYRITYFD